MQYEDDGARRRIAMQSEGERLNSVGLHSNPNEFEQDTVFINNKYKIVKSLGQGKFGTVCRGINTKSGLHVAIKMESQNAKIKLLKNETTILNYLYNENCRDIPAVFWYGLHRETVCLVMTLYECSLFDYVKRKTLSVSKIENIMIQCLSALENIHSKFVLHRDIKPQNFMIKDGNIYVIDFGFSGFYIEGCEISETSENDEPSENIIGSPKYISLNIHNGIRPSRRDDLISLGYTYMFLLCKELPWDNLHKIENTDFAEIHILHPKNIQRKTLKSFENIERLFLDNITTMSPKKIVNYIQYCYSLNYNTKPDYNALKILMSSDI